MIPSRTDIGKSGILDLFNPTLHQCLFTNDKLSPKSREKILNIAQEIAKAAKIEIIGLLMYGGAAGYQYSSRSDIDVSVYPKIDQHLVDNYDDLLLLFKNRVEEVCGLELHFYLKSPEQQEQMEANEAVYDILNDKWLVKPQHHNFNPYEEWADKLAISEELAVILKQELSNLRSILAQSTDTNPPLDILTKFSNLVGHLRDLRAKEHLALREKALVAPLTIHDRATLIELTWKYFDKEGLISTLDLIKRYVEQFDGKEKVDLGNFSNTKIDPILTAI